MSSKFKTENGILIPVITTNQMMEVDRIAIKETGPNLFQMMENAGRNLSQSVIGLTQNIDKPTIIVLAGTGGNGGGGIVAARHLLNRNYDVKIAITDESRLKEIPKVQLVTYKNAGGIVLENIEDIEADIIVDAIIGYSLMNAPKGKSLEFIKWANQKNVKKISLDVPSGIDSTTGECYGEYFNTEITMTLALPKSGLTETNCGEILLAYIVIPQKIYEMMGLAYDTPFKNEYVIPIRRA